MDLESAKSQAQALRGRLRAQSGHRYSLLADVAASIVTAAVGIAVASDEPPDWRLVVELVPDAPVDVADHERLVADWLASSVDARDDTSIEVGVSARLSCTAARWWSALLSMERLAVSPSIRCEGVSC